MSVLIIKDYGNNIHITHSDDAGGKAGRDNNKTATIQIRIGAPGFVRMIKHFQYTVINRESYRKALAKAEKYVEENLQNLLNEEKH